EASAGLPPSWDPDERAAIELLRGLRRKDRPSDEELAQRLAKGGDHLVPLFFDVLATRRVPALDPAAASPALQVLSEVQENVVLLALAEFERDSVLTRVTAAVAASATLERRAAALGCIGAVGRANDLLQLF